MNVLDRNTMKAIVLGAIEIIAYASDEPIDRMRFEANQKTLGSPRIWEQMHTYDRVHSTKLYPPEPLEPMLRTVTGHDAEPIERDGATYYPIDDALVCALAYNTGEDAPVVHTPGARYEDDHRIDAYSKPWNAEIIERQAVLLEQMRTEMPELTGSVERARDAYRWARMFL